MQLEVFLEITKFRRNPLCQPFRWSRPNGLIVADTDRHRATAIYSALVLHGVNRTKTVVVVVVVSVAAVLKAMLLMKMMQKMS